MKPSHPPKQTKYITLSMKPSHPPKQTKYITLSMKPSHPPKQTKYITLSMKPSHPPKQTKYITLSKIKIRFLLNRMGSIENIITFKKIISKLSSQNKMPISYHLIKPALCNLPTQP
jgi:hypothetical protein